MNMLGDDLTEFQQAEKTALRLIARAEQCSSGLSLKLEKRGFDTACIREVIVRLSEANLLDDKRYSGMWLRSRLHFTRSPKKLFSSLCAKGIDRGDAQAALKEVLDEETEFSLLTRYVKKNEKKSPAKTGENRVRSVKFMLKNEGFSVKSIQKFFNEE